MKVAVRAGLFIDGSGHPPGSDLVVLIEDERVTGVVRDTEGSIPSEYGILDASRYTVMPGMIDAHLHLDSSGDPGERPLPGPMGQSVPSYALNCFRNASRDLDSGFTTIRVAGSQHYADVALRDQINAGLVKGPRIWAAGQGITSTSGHMDRNKRLPPHQRNTDDLTTVADGPVEARKAVRINLSFDVDHIKINATLTEHVRRYGGYCSPEMTRDVFEAICDEAHMHGRRVTAHCYGGIGADWALSAGLDGVEHGFYLTDAQLHLMAERGVALCPTLSVPGHMRDDIKCGVSTGIPDAG